MGGAERTEYYRADGVRITHDPYSPGMAAKYGMPGLTDNEGFDPYADSVGAGIYGGIVERNELGEVVIGRQYQNHNPRPGPVYAGGGYTPTSRRLQGGDAASVAAWFKEYPELVNDVSTGGATPLHTCGMSRQAQRHTAVVIEHGGDVEALDTYGFTPLQRMASNNLDVGATALLEAGADPNFRGGCGQTPRQIARESRASKVLEVLDRFPTRKADVQVDKIRVDGAGMVALNAEYVASSAARVPDGFDAVCKAHKWDTAQMWHKLNAGATWYHAQNGAYVYFNQADQHWWIDLPNGDGAYKAPAPSHAPPAHGWLFLPGATHPAPALASFRSA